MHRWIALLACFALGGTTLAQELTIYNAGSSELIEETVAAFNAAHPEITVTVVSAGVGQHTTRIEAEAANPRGDIFFGASVESFEAIIHLFEPYTAAHDAEYDPVFVHPEKRYYGYSQPLQTFVVTPTSSRRTSARPAGPTSRTRASPARSSWPTPRSRARRTRSSLRCCSSTTGTSSRAW